MNKVFKYFLSLFSILLLVGAANFPASSASESYNDIENFKNLAISNQVSVSHPSHKENRNKFIFEITEIQEVEKDESISKDNLVSFYSCTTAFFNAHLFDNLSSQLGKELFLHERYIDKSSTKLHVRLQVFII